MYGIHFQCTFRHYIIQKRFMEITPEHALDHIHNYLRHMQSLDHMQIPWNIPSNLVEEPATSSAWVYHYMVRRLQLFLLHRDLLLLELFQYSSYNEFFYYQTNLKPVNVNFNVLIYPILVLYMINKNKSKVRI